jgi:hypothetical protein
VAFIEGASLTNRRTVTARASRHYGDRARVGTQRTLIAVARQRESRPSRRMATARVRARPLTMTTASTTPSRGSQILVDPIEKDGRVAFWARARRALVDKTTLFSRWRYTSSLTQRASCSRSRAPASTSMTQRVRFSSSGVGSGSAAVDAGCAPKKSSESKRGRDPRSWLVGSVLFDNTVEAGAEVMCTPRFPDHERSVYPQTGVITLKQSGPDLATPPSWGCG